MASMWQEIRADYPVTNEKLYFDAAGVGPVSRRVREAVQKYWQENAEEADFAWPKWMDRVAQVRQQVADFVGAHPDEIAFTSNTSHGMNLAAEILASQGTVLIPTTEFPSSTLPWIWRRASLVWHDPKSEGDLASRIERDSAKSIQTVVTSYVQYATGLREDLKKISNIKGNRLFVVNASQAFGVFPLNASELGLDFFMTNSYKWLGAGYGGGIFYIRRSWLEKSKPSALGWRSVNHPDSVDNRSQDLQATAARYELGGLNFPAIFAIGAALEYFKQIGADKISARILKLSGYAAEALTRAGYKVLSLCEEKHRSGIVVFQVNDPKTVWKKLLADGVATGLRGGGIRLALHIYNTPEEIDELILRLKKNGTHS